MTRKKLYMIRRISDGFWSSGGSYPHFTKVGKAWTTTQALHAHLNLIFSDNRGLRYNRPYDNCEIVEFEILQTEFKSTNVEEYNEKIKEARVKKS